MTVARPPLLARARSHRLDLVLGELAEAGLAGMECYYGRYSPEERTGLAAMAERHGLVATGGSDFHGSFKPDLLVGTGTGDLAVPDAALAGLLARRATGRARRSAEMAADSTRPGSSPPTSTPGRPTAGSSRPYGGADRRVPRMEAHGERAALRVPERCLCHRSGRCRPGGWPAPGTRAAASPGEPSCLPGPTGRMGAACSAQRPHGPRTGEALASHRGPPGSSCAGRGPSDSEAVVASTTALSARAPQPRAPGSDRSVGFRRYRSPSRMLDGAAGGGGLRHEVRRVRPGRACTSAGSGSCPPPGAGASPPPSVELAARPPASRPGAGFAHLQTESDERGPRSTRKPRFPRSSNGIDIYAVD